ncbi:MAG: hypothetical protein AAFY71_22350 [Bacteroidota bacterium]
MEDRQQVVSLFFSKSEYEAGLIDVTERLYKQVDKEKIESIKYVMHTAAEDGIYYTVVLIKKKQESTKGVMGFTR